MDKRRKKRQKFKIQENEVNKLAEMKMTNGWQVQNPKKLLKKLKHEAQREIRHVDTDNDRNVSFKKVVKVVQWGTDNSSSG